MATWWVITFTGEPTDEDLEHVAEQVREGFTSGRLIEIPDDDGSDLIPYRRLPPEGQHRQPGSY